MSSKGFYVQKMKRLHSRYNLSGNSVLLLKALDDYHLGIIGHDELGRIVRMSKKNRKAVTDTISKCAAMMEKTPGEMKDCVALIQNCTEILTAADEPKETDSLPFLKFPKEIRIKIYKYCLSRGYAGDHGLREDLMHKTRQTHCTCFPKTDPTGFTIQTALACTSKLVMEEYLETMYSCESFSFGCTCEMYRHLTNNVRLRETVRRIKVHWCGPDADRAFAQLEACPQLQILNVAISRATTIYMTRRQQEILPYFPTQKQSRLCDALGIDELLKLRGLQVVRVSHILARQGMRRTEEERICLLALLRSKILEAGVAEDDNF